MTTESVSRPNRRVLQFGLRSLMILMTVCCIAFALLSVPPMLALVLAILFSAVTGVLVISIWKGRGWVRPFAAGAIVPHLCSLFLLQANHPFEAIIGILVVELVAILSGTAAAAYHGFLARRDGYLPVPNVPLIRTWFSND